MVVPVSKYLLFVRPLFFPDKNLVVIAYENTVEVHNSQHDIVWKLEEKSKIVNLDNYEDFQFKFYIVYENGDIKLCDIDTQNVILVMQMKKEIKNVFFCNQDVIVVENEIINLYYKYDINKKKQIIDKSFQYMAFGKKTGIIGMVDNLTVSVACVHEDKFFSYKLTRKSKIHYLTAVACHPSEPIVATGETTGKIYIWWDVATSLKRYTVFHWHFLSLKTLEFNYDGSHLLSGGREQVLVKWEFSLTDKKKKHSCLPRLESDIDSIRSCVGESGEFYLVTLADNSIQIVSTSLTVTNSYSGLIQRPLFLHNKISKLCPLNPVGLRSCHNLPSKFYSCVMINGHEGKLQFFDLNRHSTEYQLDVACQNWPTESENYFIPGFIQVQLVSTSNCGLFLATYECLGVIKNEFDSQRSLRTFQWNDSNQKFELESKIQLDCLDKLTDMVFHPVNKEYLLVTTNSMTLILIKRNIKNEIPNWIIINSVELEEVLYRFKIKIEMSTKNSPVKLVTIENGSKNGDGILVVTKCDCLVVYQWSNLLKFNTKPVFAVTLETLAEDLDMANEKKKYLQSTIMSSAVFKHETSLNCYRIVLGLPTGLIVVETVIKSHSSVELKTVTSAISKCGVKSLSTYPETFGSKSKVAVLFENSDHLTIFSVWNDNSNNTRVISVPPLDDVTWIPVKNRTEWVLIGLLKDNHIRSIVICEDEAAQNFNEKIVKEIKTEEMNLLSLIEDVDQDIKKEKIVNRRLHKRLDRSFMLYDPKSAPSATIILKSMYSI